MCKSDISEENTSQTTMMIRNIPCRYLDDDVQNILDEIGFKDTFNFVFTPCKGRSNLGYTFVDFKTPELAAELKRRLAGQAFGGRHDHKYCDVVPAHLQGAIANKFAKRSRKAEKIRIESVQDDLFFGANLIGIDPVAPGAWGDDLALSGSGLKGSQAAQDYYRIPGTVPPAGLPPSPAGIRRPPGAWARPPPPSLPHRCVPQEINPDNTEESPQALTAAATSLRTAAEAMLEEDLETAWGELEVAAISCPGYLPTEAFQGLVDLFSYVDPAPREAWPPASAALQALSSCVIAAAGRAEASRRRLRGTTREAFEKASQALGRAARLFAPGGFRMPPDPRAKLPFGGAGGPGPLPGSRSSGPWPFGGATAVVQRPRLPQLPAGSFGAQLAAEVQAELDRLAGEDPSTQRAALRRLVRRCHPDQNPGREAEVLPVFEYVQQLREMEVTL